MTQTAVKPVRQAFLLLPDGSVAVWRSSPMAGVLGMPRRLFQVCVCAKGRLSVQDGSVSVWRRTPNQLTYSLLGLHKLVPPPSRVNNNATISLLCAAASAWVRLGSAMQGLLWMSS